MSLEDEVKMIMGDAIKNNPVAQRALAGVDLVDDTHANSDDMASIMSSMNMGNRNAIIHLARHVDERVV